MSYPSLFFERRMLCILLLAFSSGLPLALIGSTLQAQMSSLGVDLRIIGTFSLVSIPFTIKFLWAPLLDRYKLPLFDRRRGWILLFQGFLAFLLFLMAETDPNLRPTQFGLIALLIAFFSASQDIVIDAYRTEILKPKEFATGSALQTLGYRLAMMFSGAFALILSDHFSWKMVYWIMALTMLCGTLVTLICPAPPADFQSPKSIKEAIFEPLRDFFKRPGIWEVFLFILVYKMDVVVTLALMTPFLLELGFSKTDIGAVWKGFGLVATLAGTFTGASLLKKMKIQTALWSFGILQGLSGLCFLMLAKVGNNYPLFVGAIASENFFSGMGNSAYAAFLMSLCNPKYTGSQFAVLTSLMSLTRTLAGAPTGWLVKSVGWEIYFTLALTLMLPGLLLLTRYSKWTIVRK